MNDTIFTTLRLAFRPLSVTELPDLIQIFGDKRVMYAWEHTFNIEQINAWIATAEKNYKIHGYGFWAAYHTLSGAMVGVIGLIPETINNMQEIGVAYLLKHQYWGNGYGVEGVVGCIKYGFDQLNAPSIIADIRPNNIPSVKLAMSIGMKEEDTIIKHYRGQEMPHTVYRIKRP